MKIKLIISFQVIFLLFCSFVFSDNITPLFENNYIGEKNRILATSNDIKITEQQFYLYLLLNRTAPAYILNDYLTNKSPIEKQDLYYLIKDEIQNLLVLEYASLKNPDKMIFNENDNYKIRYLLYSAYEYVWINNYLKGKDAPKVIVYSEDIKKYYNEKKNDEFLIPEKTQVRYIYINSPEGETEPERARIKLLLESVRQNTKTEDDFSSYAIRISEAPSKKNGGLIPTFSRGTLSQDFEELAFSLSPKQISNVTELSDGFYLVYCVNKFKEDIMSLESVEEEIKSKLMLRFLKLQYDIELQRLVKKYRPINEYLNWEYLKDKDKIIKVGRFVLTKKQIIEQFPELLLSDNKINMEALSAKCLNITNKEVLIRSLQKNKWLNHPYLIEAERIAKKIIAFDKIINSSVSNKIQIADDILQDYYNNNISRFANIDEVSYFEITAMLPNSEIYLETQKQENIKLMNRILVNMSAEMDSAIKKLSQNERRVFSETLQKKNILTPDSPIEMKVLNPILKKYENKYPQYYFKYKKHEHINLEENPELKERLKDIKPETITKNFIWNNTVFFYYLYDENIIKDMSFDNLKDYIKNKYTESIHKKEIEDFKDKIINEYPVDFYFQNIKY